MKTIDTASVPSDQIDALEQYARTNAGPEMRDVLLAISHCVREGAEFAVIKESAELTPSEAAQLLRMSRTHLYKLLDRGEIVFHRVGRDRRIRMRDLLDFDKQRERDRRELAERFAGQQQTQAGATDEIADLL